MPKYIVGNKSYTIPSEKAGEFENDMPDASVKLYANGKSYTVPVEKVEGFKKKYTDWSYDEPKVDGVTGGHPATEQKENQGGIPEEWVKQIRDAANAPQTEADGLLEMANAERRAKEEAAVQSGDGEMVDIDRWLADKHTAVSDAIRPNNDVRMAVELAALNSPDAVAAREEERRIDNTFTPKEVTSPADIYTNYRERFALTERGAQLGKEMSDVGNRVMAEYGREYLITPEYRKLHAEYTDKIKKAGTKEEAEALNEEFSGKANEQFGLMYGSAIDEKMKPLRDIYDRELVSRYGKQMENETYALEKRQSADMLGEMSVSLDEKIEAKEQAFKDKRKRKKERFGTYGRSFPGLTSGRGIPSGTGRQNEAPVSGVLRSAKRYLDKAQETLDAARNGTFVSGLATLADWNKWTFGLSDMADYANLNHVLNKSSKGDKLTEDEQTLIDAALMNMTIQGYYANDVNGWYKAGSITAESIPVMLEMLVNPIAGSGNAVAKGLLNYGLKKFGQAATKKAVEKGLRITSNLVGHGLIAPAGVTATSSMGRVGASTLEHLNENYDIKQGGDGKAVAVKNDRDMGFGEAFARGAGTTFFANQSEKIFDAFPGAKAILDKIAPGAFIGGAPELLSRIDMKKIGGAWAQVRNNPMMKGLKKRAGIGGIAEEYLEEVYNNFANVAIGEMSLEDATSMEQNVETFCGLIPMQVMFSTIGVVGYANQRRINNRNINRYRGMLNEQAIAEVEAAAQAARNDDGKMEEYFTSVMMDPSLSPAQRKARLALATELQRRNALDAIGEEKGKTPPTPQEAALEAGYQAETPEEMHAINNRYEQARAWRESLTDEDGQLGHILDMEDRDAAMEQLQVGYGDYMQQAIDYWAAIDSYDGMVEGVADRVDGAIEEMNWQAARRANLDGNLISATTVNGDTVYIKRGNVAVNPEAQGEDSNVDVAQSDKTIYVIGDDGKLRMMAPNNLHRVSDEITALSQVLDYNNTTLRNQLLKQETEEIELNPNTPLIVPGMPIQGEDGVQMVVTDVQGENAMVAPLVDGKAGEAKAVPASELRGMLSRQLDAEAANNGQEGGKGNNIAENIPENGNIDTENIPTDTQEAEQQPSAFERVPKDEQGNPIYEQADADTAWDAIVEQAEGDEAIAGEVVADIVAEAEKEHKAAEKVLKNAMEAKPEKKKGAAPPTMDERIAIKKQAKANIEAAQAAVEQAKAKLEKWKEIAKRRKQTAQEVDLFAQEAERMQKQAEVQAAKEAERMQKEAEKRAAEEEAARLKAEEEAAKLDMKLLGEPMNGQERAAMALGTGEIRLTRDSYMRETGFGNEEAKGMFGLFAGKDKGGKTIDDAAHYLWEYDEEGFYHGDTQEARNAILDVLMSARKKSELRNYIANSRRKQAEEVARAEREAYEEFCERNFHMTPEEYEAYVEVTEQNALRDLSVEEKDAIFAEERQRYYEYINSLEHEQGRTESSAERGDTVLPEEQVDDTGGDGQSSTGGQNIEDGGRADSENAAAQEGAEGEIKPVGRGAFGNIYDQFRGKAREAIAFLLGRREGEAVGALSHPEIGEISLVWGNSKAGLEKIAKKHSEVLGDLQEIINGMHVVSKSDNRIKLESDTHFAVVSREYLGQPREQWLLTAYEKKETSEPTNSRMDVESNLDGKSDDTATRQDSDVSDSKDTTNPPTLGEADEKNGFKFLFLNDSNTEAFKKQALERYISAIKSIRGKSGKVLKRYESLLNKGVTWYALFDSNNQSSAPFAVVSSADDVVKEALNHDVPEFEVIVVNNADRTVGFAPLSVPLEYEDNGELKKSVTDSVTAKIRSLGGTAEAEVLQEREGEAPFREVPAEDVIGRAAAIAAQWHAEREEKRRKPLRARAKAWADALGVKVNVVERLDDVKNAAARRAIENGAKIAGWFEEATGEVVVYLPFNDNVKEADKTVLHELVGHKGLRGLLGKAGFDALCEKVWAMMPKKVQERYTAYSGVGHIADETERRRAAADEYMAALAERQRLLPKQKTIWDKIKEALRELFSKRLGKDEVLAKDNLGDKDIEELLRMSYRKMAERSLADGISGAYRTRFRDTKRAPETASTSEGKRHQTVVSSADGAKVLNNLDNLAKEYEESESTQPKTTIGDVARAYVIFNEHDLDIVEHTRFRISGTPEEFEATQKEAVKKNGIVAAGLNEAVLNVVDVPRHDFAGRGIDAIHKAEKWANDNLAKAHTYHKGKADEFTYTIDKDAIGKFLSKSSTKGSDNLGVHLAVLKELPKVIDNSIEAEIHPDYQKKDGVRSAENGIGRKDMLVHRMYGAVNIDGKTYRAKTTIHEFKNKENKAYDYKITEVELIVSGSSTSNARTNPTSISAAKILQGVEKSYDKGKKLLDESENTRFRSLEEVNERFNEELDAFKENRHEGLLHLGYPREVLSAAGVNARELTLSPTVLHQHLKKHGLTTDDLKGLSKAVQSPILVYKHGENKPNLVVVTELEVKGGKISVALRLDEDGSVVEVSNISSVHSKDATTEIERLSMLDSDKLKEYLRWVEKEKVSDWLGLPSEEERQGANPKLVSLAKVIESFENPKLPGENVTRYRAAKEKNELVAVHNISEDNLRKVLGMGLLIMPSIAITKADMGHEGYGEISLLFGKDTISPTDRRNKVYGGDAWTPRFPAMDVKLNDKAVSRVNKKIYELIDNTQLRNLYSLSSEVYPGNIERIISNNGVKGYYGKEWMKLAYLLDNGKKVKIPMKPVDYGGMSETVINLAKERGFKLSDIKNDGVDFFDNNPDFVEAVHRANIENKVKGVSDEAKRNAVKELLSDQEMTFSRFDSLISRAVRMEYDIEHGGLKQIIDRGALTEAINKKVKTDNAEYNKWVDGLFGGIIEKYGIRNDKDPFTPSGGSRSWEQLHDAATPANILKHMLAENEQGGSGGFFDSNIMGASAESYESIEEIRKKGKARLKKMDAEEYDKWSQSVSDRMAEICNDFMSEEQRDNFGDSVDAKIEITNAVSKDRTAKGIYKQMRREYPGFTMEHAKQVEAIVKEIQDSVIGYFEAKPRRIVALSEVKKAIVPNNVSSDILEGLKKNSVEVVTYRKGNEAARQRLIKKESEGVRFRELNKNQDVFVSNAERAVTGIKQEKATPQQWLAMIEKQGGLKAGEDKWLGLSEWLKASTAKTLTKQEVMDFIGENRIRIEEVTYEEEGNTNKFFYDYFGNDYNLTSEAYDEMEDRYGLTTEDEFDYMPNEWFEFTADSLEDKLEMAKRANYNARFFREDNYDLDDELEAEDFIRQVEVEIMQDMDRWTQDEYSINSGNPINSTRLEYTTEGLENKREIALTVPTIEPWNEGDDIHFGDAGGGRAVAWVRFGETTDSDGKRVLVIDEIQSKRHQEGREKGYMPTYEKQLEIAEDAFEESRKRYEAVVEKHSSINAALLSKYGIGFDGATESELQELRDAYEDMYLAKEMMYTNKEKLVRISRGERGRGIPAAPFEKNWHELAMKRMLRLAAEEGYDKVAWTTGAQQAERYDLSKSVDSIESERLGDGYRMAGFKNGEIVFAEFVEKDKLSDVVGKEIASKIVESEDKDMTFTGEDFRIGGEGMKGFYDKMLPSFVQKYVKKWGAKVGEVELPEVEEAGRRMWSVDVTPEMRESVMEGQTMFREITDPKIQREVDKFAKRYNATPVEELPSEREEMIAFAMEEGYSRKDAEDLYEEFKNTAAAYDWGDDIIYIFAGKVPADKVEEILIHENVHRAVWHLLDDEKKSSLADALYGLHPSLGDEIRRSPDYKEADFNDEMIAYSMQFGHRRGMKEYLGELAENEQIKNILNFINYDGRRKKNSVASEAGAENAILAETRNIGKSDSRREDGRRNQSMDTRQARVAQSNDGQDKKRGAEGLASSSESVGLRDLLGPRFGRFIDGVVLGLPSDVFSSVVGLVPRSGWDFRRAAAVFFSGLAERYARGEAKAKELAGRIREAVVNALKRMNVAVSESLSDGGLLYELWRGLRDVRPDDVLGRAEDIFMRSRLDRSKTDEVNSKFNEELSRFTLETADSFNFDLGMPSGALLAGGVKNRPIRLHGSKVAKKMKKHGFKAEELRNLPAAVAYPIAVFDNLGRTGNRSILTELKTAQGNFLVSVDLGRGSEVDFDIVSSVFGKNGKGIVDWMNTGKLRWVNKEKALNYLHLSAPIAEALDKTELISAVKIVEEFENPTVLNVKSNEEIRFRDVTPLRKRYDRAVRRPTEKNDVGWYENLPERLQEAYQDSMLALKKLQDLVAEATDSEVKTYEDAYMAENRMSSENKAQAEMYNRDFYMPLMEEVQKLVKDGVDYEGIKQYLIAKHGLERNALMSKREAEKDGGTWDGTIKDYSGLSTLTGEEEHFTAAAQKMVAEFEKKHNTDALWERINAATKESLKKSYDCGMMNRATYEKVRDMYEHYIPLRGWDTDVAENEYEYLTGGRLMLSPALKVAKGRKSLADDPIATIGFMAESSIVQGNRNKMKQKFLNLAMNHKNELLTVTEQWYVLNNATGKWEAQNPEIPETATGDEVTDLIEKFEEKMKALGDKATTKREGLELNLHATKYQEQEHVVRVMRGGKEYAVYVNGNPRAAQAVNGLTNPDASESGLYKGSMEVKNFMAKMFTSQNPAFIVTNLSRDLVWAGTSVAVKEDGRYTAQYTKNIMEALAKAELPKLLKKYSNGTLDENVPIERYFAEFIKNGGETGFTQLNNVDQYKKKIKALVEEAKGKKRLGKKAWDSVWDSVEFLNRSAEDTTRFMVYMTSRQMGRDIARSVWDAKEITVNFNKKGSGGMGGSFMNFCYIFFNATIQSLANFGKLMARHPGKMASMLATYSSAGLVVPMMNTLLPALFGDDGDEYWELPEWVRRNNIVIKIPFTEKSFITIPLPHELRPIYGMGELVYSCFAGRENVDEALSKAALGFTGLLPIDLTGNGGNLAVNLTPTIGQPVAQIMANVDYFGKPIYRNREWNELYPEWTKAYRGTNSLLIDATELLNEWSSGDDVARGDINLNPATIEHLVEGYLGGVGKTLNRTYKTVKMIWDEDQREWRNVPVASSFIQQVDERKGGSGINARYYDAIGEMKDVEHLLRGYNKLVKQGESEYAQKLKNLKSSDRYKSYLRTKKYVDYINELSSLKGLLKDENRIEETILSLKKDMLGIED